MKAVGTILCVVLPQMLLCSSIRKHVCIDASTKASQHQKWGLAVMLDVPCAMKKTKGPQPSAAFM